MTAFEITVLVFLVVMLLAIGLLVRRTSPAPLSQPALPPIAGGEPTALELVHHRIDDVMSAVAALHDDVLRRPAGAAPLATAPPKAHRPQFVLASEEYTNKVRRLILTCRVEGCPDTLVIDEPEPSLVALLARGGGG